MLTPEDHAEIIRSFDVDDLLTLITVEAHRFHGGHYAIFACTTGYKVAFGTPDLDGERGRAPLARLAACPTLKEALIHAIVSGKAFKDYEDDDPFDPDKFRIPEGHWPLRRR